jgi:hypothetical protein
MLTLLSAFVFLRYPRDEPTRAEATARAAARAVLATVALAPLRRASIVLQTQDSDPRVFSGALPRCWSICHCITTLWRDQGFWSLWRGSAALVLFTALNTLSQMLEDALVPVLIVGDKGLDKTGLFPDYSGFPNWTKLLRACATLLAIIVATRALAYPLQMAYTNLCSGVLLSHVLRICAVISWRICVPLVTYS